MRGSCISGFCLLAVWSLRRSQHPPHFPPSVDSAPLGSPGSSADDSDFDSDDDFVGGQGAAEKTLTELLQWRCGGNAMPKIELAVLLDNSSSFKDWLKKAADFLPKFISHLRKWQPDLRVSVSRFCDRPDIERDRLLVSAEQLARYPRGDYPSRYDRCFYPISPLTYSAGGVITAFNEQIYLCYGGEPEEDQLTAMTWVANKYAGFTPPADNASSKATIRILLTVTDAFTKYGTSDLDFDGNEPPCEDNQAFTPISQAGTLLRKAQVFPLVYLATDYSPDGLTTPRKWRDLFIEMGYARRQFLIKQFKMEDSSEVQVKGLLGSTIKQACEALAEPISIPIEEEIITIEDVGESAPPIGGDGDQKLPPRQKPSMKPPPQPPADSTNQDQADGEPPPRRSRMRMYGIIGALVGAFVVAAGAALVYYQNHPRAMLSHIVSHEFEFEGGENLDEEFEERQEDEPHMVFTGEDTA